MREEGEISQVMQTEKERKATERHRERQRHSQKQKVDAAWSRGNDCSFVSVHLEAKWLPVPSDFTKQRGEEEKWVNKLKPNGDAQLHYIEDSLMKERVDNQFLIIQVLLLFIC